MRKILIALAMASCAFATAYTSAASGNWTTSTNWTPNGIPGSGDTVSIGAHTITIPSGSPTTIGSGSGNAIAITSASGILRINDSLTINGTLSAVNSSNIVAGYPDATALPGPITITLTPPNAGAQTFSITNQSNTFTANGSLTNRITLLCSPTGTGTCTYGGNLHVANLSHVTFRGFNNPSTTSPFYGIEFGGTTTLRDVLFDGNTHVGFVSTSATISMDVDGVDFRNTLIAGGAPGANALTFSLTAAKTGGLRSFKNMTVDFTGDQSIVLSALDTTISDSVISHGFLNPTNALRTTMSRIFNIADFYALYANTSVSGIVSGIRPNGGMTFQTWGIVQCNGSSGGPHMFVESGADGAVSGNLYDDMAADGCADGRAGDFILPAGVYTASHILMTNALGNLTDGFYAGASGTIKYNTADRNYIGTVNPTGYWDGVITVAETNVTTTKLGIVESNLFSNLPNVLGMENSGYLPQTSMYYDYNGFSNIQTNWGGGNSPGSKAAMLWNEAVAHAGSVANPHAGATRTGAIVIASKTADSPITGNTTYTFTSDLPTAGLIAGDYAIVSGHMAMVKSVAYSAPTSTVVLGPQEDGTAPFSTNGTVGASITFYKNMWASGQYGDDGKGLHEVYALAQYRDDTRTALTWDTACGGPGTFAHVNAEVVKLNGWAHDATAATFNSCYTLANWMAYMKWGYTSMNGAYKGSGHTMGDDRGVSVHPPVLTIMQ